MFPIKYPLKFHGKKHFVTLVNNVPLISVIRETCPPLAALQALAGGSVPKKRKVK